MLEEIVPLDPVSFFAFQIECPYLKNKKFDKRQLLPDLSSFYGERKFAEVFMAWNEQGLHFQIEVNGKFDTPEFPNFGLGDSVELFIDTRDVKNAGFITRYCHHFFFLPEAVETQEEYIQAGEVTRFRADDTHELCDPALLSVESILEKKVRTFKIFIPSECLYGYDPAQFDRFGFTYRINKVSGAKQNFSASDADFPIEGQPSLWASIKLVK